MLEPCSISVELLAITPDAERVIERAGRTAYLSFDKEDATSHERFIRMLLKRGHLSVLEHASATVAISGVSRACTHQLVRHRLCSFTQQSQRYVDESGFRYIEPPSIAQNPEAHKLFETFLEQAHGTYQKLHELGIKNEDARFVLPNAVESQIVVTASFREWRHIVEIRGEKGAQWEIRRLAVEILRTLKRHAPTVFGDYVIDEERFIVSTESPPA